MIVARPRIGRAAGREPEESREAKGLDDWSTRRVAVAKRAEDSIEGERFAGNRY